MVVALQAGRYAELYALRVQKASGKSRLEAGGEPMVMANPNCVFLRGSGRLVVLPWL
jgi:hypothetical protein